MCDTREFINIPLPADTDRFGLQHFLFFRDKRAENHYSTFNLCPRPAVETMSLREPALEGTRCLSKLRLLVEHMSRRSYRRHAQL